MEPAARGDSARLSRLEWGVLALALLLGIFLRIDGVSDEALFGDEHHILPNVEKGYASLFSITHPIKYLGYAAYGLLQCTSVTLFGPGVFSFRIPSIVGGILGLLLLFPLGRYLVGSRAAWFATLLLAVHPMHVYYSRFARSYTLMFLGALILLCGVWRALPRDGPVWPKRWQVVVALTAGLLPLMHIVEAGFVAAVGTTSLFLAWNVRRNRRDVFDTIGVFGAGALLCLGFLWPALGGLTGLGGGGGTEGGVKVVKHVKSFTGLTTIFGGGVLAGLVLTGSAAVTWALMLKRDLRLALYLAIAFVSAPVVLALTSPPGMDYTYSRYAISSFVILLLLGAWGIQALVARLLPGSHLGLVRTLVLVGLVGAHAWHGPLWGHGLREVQFSNVYFAQHTLPPFDVPFDATPAFYLELAERQEPVTLIECPVTHGSTELFRNYGLQHRQRVLVGSLEPLGAITSNGPYVALKNLAALADSGADYVVLHSRVSNEVKQYASFVRDQRARYERWGEGNLLDKFLDGWNVSGDSVNRIRKRLRAEYGEPVYRDDFIQVWALDSPAPAEGGEPEAAGVEEAEPRNRARRQSQAPAEEPQRRGDRRKRRDG